MKSIDTYLCRNQKPVVVEFYDMKTNEAIMSDGSRCIIHSPRCSGADVYDVLRSQNPRVQVRANLSDGYWPLRLLAVCVFGWIIYKGLSQ